MDPDGRGRTDRIARVLAGFDEMMQLLAASHAPEFIETSMTMSQAKAVYLIATTGRLGLSELAARLGVGASTASEVVERLVEAGLVGRADDPLDRRHVVLTVTPDGLATLQRMRELNSRQMRTLLDRIGDDDLVVVESAVRIFTAAAADVRRRDHTKGRLVSRLSELAIAKRSVTLLLAGALFIAGISAWSSLQQELLPDIDFPVISVIAPYPGAGSQDVADQVTEPIERAISGVPRLEVLQSTSANSVALVVAQFSFGTDVKETLAQIQQNLDATQLPPSVDPTASAFNLNQSPVIVASIAATSEDGLPAVAEIARTEIVPQILGLDGVSRADVTGGIEQQVLVTLDPEKLAAANISSQQVVGVLQANNLTFPAGQLSADETQIPVTTIGRFTSIDQIRGPRGRCHARADRADRPADDADAGHDRRARDGRVVGRRDDRLRPDERSAGPRPDRHEDLHGEHGRRRRGGRGDPRRHRGSSPERPDGHDRQRSVHVHQGVPRRPAPRRRARRGLRDPHDLPVPWQHPLDARRGDQHPALDRHRARRHAARRDQPEHHDPGRPGGRRRAGRRRRDRRPREHLSAQIDRGGSTHRGHPRATRGGRRDHRQHPDDRRGVPADRVRRRPRQPVLPAVRADGHVRPAGVAHLRPDCRPRARLPVHRSGLHRGRRERRAQALVLGPGLHAAREPGPA